MSCLISPANRMYTPCVLFFCMMCARVVNLSLHHVSHQNCLSCRFRTFSPLFFTLLFCSLFCELWFSLLLHLQVRTSIITYIIAFVFPRWTIMGSLLAHSILLFAVIGHSLPLFTLLSPYCSLVLFLIVGVLFCSLASRPFCHFQTLLLSHMVSILCVCRVLFPLPIRFSPRLAPPLSSVLCCACHGVRARWYIDRYIKTTSR